MRSVSNPEPDSLLEQETFWGHLKRFLLTKPLGASGLMIVVFYILIAIFANQLSPYHPLDADWDNQLTAPDWQHWLGTDENGRDILSRIIHGSRTAMLVGFVAAFVGATSGLFIGVSSAYFGGKVDLFIQRLVDIFMSFPLIIMALSIVAIFGTGVQNVILAITIPMVPRCARVVRASALPLRNLPYIDAARALGFGHWRIIVRHMAPNVMATYLIMLTAFMGQAVLAEASLSFLGLGVQEPQAAWGLMLQGGAEQYAESAPWVAIAPGVAITISVFAFNLFGDALRDVLDPRLRV